MKNISFILLCVFVIAAGATSTAGQNSKPLIDPIIGEFLEEFSDMGNEMGDSEYAEYNAEIAAELGCAQNSVKYSISVHKHGLKLQGTCKTNGKNFKIYFVDALKNNTLSSFIAIGPDGSSEITTRKEIIEEGDGAEISFFLEMEQLYISLKTASQNKDTPS